LTKQEKNVVFNKFSNVSFISCHRQYGYDFRDLDPDVKVISIAMDRVDFLAKRLLEFHTTKFELNLMNSPLKNKVPYQDLVKAEYNKWAKTNILESDIKLNFSAMMNHQQVQAWCNHNNLPFCSDNAKEWIDNFQNYSANAV
jgi:hypothetical protein